jgi:hypothetical protein
MINSDITLESGLSAIGDYGTLWEASFGHHHPYANALLRVSVVSWIQVILGEIHPGYGDVGRHEWGKNRDWMNIVRSAREGHSLALSQTGYDKNVLIVALPPIFVSCLEEALNNAVSRGTDYCSSGTVEVLLNAGNEGVLGVLTQKSPKSNAELVQSLLHRETMSYNNLLRALEEDVVSLSSTLL